MESFVHIIVFIMGVFTIILRLFIKKSFSHRISGLSLALGLILSVFFLLTVPQKVNFRGEYTEAVLYVLIMLLIYASLILDKKNDSAKVFAYLTTLFHIPFIHLIFTILLQIKRLPYEIPQVIYKDEYIRIEHVIIAEGYSMNRSLNIVKKRGVMEYSTKIYIFDSEMGRYNWQLEPVKNNHLKIIGQVNGIKEIDTLISLK